ncbi:hypothetical protein AB0K18_49645 [Nonomuraea sp. NPDC049421]|uniref:hypothetical protein n=1 Tax=Nonomuraea sp. NPDC049421 TaxID=3155275 RepID=UPI003448BFDE
MAVVAALAYALLLSGTVSGCGPLVPGGGLSVLLYPLPVVWMVPACVAMWREHTGHTGHTGVRR